MAKHPLDRMNVISSGEDRDEWLRARAEPNILTATQITAIAGSSPYLKPIDVWNQKTDPDYTTDHLRNIYLEERAALGHEREPRIIEWASEDEQTGGPESPFIPNTRLVAHPKRMGLASLPEGAELDLMIACTPDAAKLIGRKLELAECKATQQRWDKTGIPQHILDQCYIQLYVTGAARVWLAVEFVEWSGRGANKTSEIVGRMLRPISMDQNRLNFLLEKVEQFRAWLEAGIAPESDIYLTKQFEPAVSFDDTSEEIQEKQAAAAEARRLDALLTELDGIQRKLDEVKPLEKRATAIKSEIKKLIVGYEGRRIHMIGERRIAQLIRSNPGKIDKSKIPDAILQPAMTWGEVDTLTIVANPEYKHAEESDEADSVAPDAENV